MGYYTSHSLSWNAETPTEEEVTARLAPLMELSPDQAASIALNGESDKWYESDQHVALISKEWPQVLFTMDCSGENGEAYVVFFRNGLHLTRDYIKPEFDEADFAANATPVPPTP